MTCMQIWKTFLKKQLGTTNKNEQSADIANLNKYTICFCSFAIGVFASLKNKQFWKSLVISAVLTFLHII